MSATSAAMRLALARKASEAGETAEPMAGMDEFLSDEFDRAGELQVSPNAVGCHGGRAELGGKRDASAICERDAPPGIVLAQGRRALDCLTAEIVDFQPQRFQP